MINFCNKKLIKNRIFFKNNLGNFSNLKNIIKF